MTVEGTGIFQQRWVVFDTVTTGTNPRQDRLVSIAAIAVEDFSINPEDSFECLVRIPFNSSAVVVHGITREETVRDGIEEKEAIQLFRDYIGNAPLVGHHVGFDGIVINQSSNRNGLPLLEQKGYDVMKMVIALEERKAIFKRANETDFSLDGLLELFEIPKSGRHTAMGDSFLTAMLWMQLLGIAKKKCPEVLSEVAEQLKLD